MKLLSKMQVKNFWASSMKRLALLGLASLMLVGSVGCGNTTPGNQTAATQTVIQVNGSTSVEPLLRKLSDQYTAKNPNTSMEIQAPGSSAGIKAVHDGSAQIGMSSRELKGDELTWGLNATTIAYDGIAVVVHPSNPVKSLTTEQVNKIFSGEITNWKEVGGSDKEILLVIREAGSGTRDAFEEIVKLYKDKDGKKVSTVAEDKAIVADSTNAISQNVAGKENAIGYVSLGSLNTDITKAVQLNGVDCTIDNVKNKTYSLQRPFLLLTQGKPSAEIQSFLDYILGADGQAQVVENKIHFRSISPSLLSLPRDPQQTDAAIPDKWPRLSFGKL